MRLALIALLAFAGCTGGPTPAADQPAAGFADTNADGLPDARAQGFGFESFGQAAFVDTDGDGLPDARLPQQAPTGDGGR